MNPQEIVRDYDVVNPILHNTIIIVGCKVRCECGNWYESIYAMIWKDQEQYPPKYNGRAKQCNICGSPNFNSMTPPNQVPYNQ